MHQVEAITGRFKDVRSPTGGGGQALTTTAVCVGLPIGSEWMSLTARNFATAVAVQYYINPYLYIIKTSDSLVVKDNLSNQSNELQDGDTTDFAIDNWDTAANGHFLYVGAADKFGGAYVVSGSAANGTASLLTVKYWNGAWTSISETDGTETGGTTTMAQTGLVTWTVPASWKADSLLSIGDTTLKGADLSWTGESLYWTRWEVDTQLDADCDISGLLALNKDRANSTYAELFEGQAQEFAIKTGQTEGVGSVEVRTDAGTANVGINVATRRRGAFA